MENIKKEKKIFNFKTYYDNNPEFKAKHLAKMREKVVCECGRTVNKSHHCKHLRSDIHIRDSNKKNAIIDIKRDKCDELQEQINELKKLFNVV